MKTILFLIFCNVLVCQSASDFWDYIDQNAWCSVSKACCGSSQSPIKLWETWTDIKLTPPFVFTDYETLPTTVTATNNGHSISLTFTGVSPKISGGGLAHTYNLDSLHFHWGINNYQGAEHFVNNDKAPMELHLVHYNSKYSSLADAVASKNPDALAVLGVLYWINNRLSNSPLESIASRMGDLQYKDQRTNINPFAFKQLLPQSTKSFFRYFGSLTTPTCDEVVVWTVFSKQAYISESQINAFRSTFSTGQNEVTKKSIANNYRFIQKLNGRKVFQCFESDKLQ